MNEQQPIRVVVFTSGPVLDHGVKRFLCRLEATPDIDLVRVISQSARQGFTAVAMDLWQRRRFMGIPLLGIFLLEHGLYYLTGLRAELHMRRIIQEMRDRIVYVPDIHAVPVLESLQALAPDLGLIYGSPILKPALFEIPRCGTLGIHHGKLPAYRGKKTMFWAMYNSEPTAGVTIQKVNAGLDTGQIVKEGEVPIGRRSRRVVWQQLEQLGLDLYVQAILEIRAGTATFKPFPGKKGPLYRDPKLSDLIRFWLRRIRQ